MSDDQLPGTNEVDAAFRALDAATNHLPGKHPNLGSTLDEFLASEANPTEVTRRMEIAVPAPSGQYTIDMSFWNSDDDIEVKCDSGSELTIWACDIDALIAGLQRCRARYVEHWGSVGIAEQLAAIARRKAGQEKPT